jgi:site-specific recombinase XerD
LTVDVYRREIDRFAQWRGAKTDIRRVSPATIARYFTTAERWVAEPKARRTVNRAKTALRMWFAYAEAAGTVRASPVRLLRNAKTDAAIGKVMSAGEMERFEAVLEERAVNRAGRRDVVLFRLLIETGMRLTAALNVRVEDLELDSGALITEGKHARVQRVAFPEGVARGLAGLIEENGTAEGPVFRGRSGEPLSARAAQYRFRLVLAAAGVETDVGVHSLRRGFARRILEETGDPRAASVALGHRSALTLGAYV